MLGVNKVRQTKQRKNPAYITFFNEPGKAK